jgi:hypothetical protein
VAVQRAALRRASVEIRDAVGQIVLGSNPYDVAIDPIDFVSAAIMIRGAGRGSHEALRLVATAS